ncbi:hypothetical protein C7974DRAFT_283195, partial [Boeremia exigua]|uniref:uncharacterized protein n=1 Tax=Boeremia exigua TaxID=749465 RepID=UPI001E8CE08C
MPRARFPSASLIASADGLLLPWLAPRAFAESAGPPRRHGAPQKDARALRRGPVAGAHAAGLPHRPRLGPAQSGACLAPTRTRPADLRYLDIASFAHHHARAYATDSQAAPADSPHRTTATNDARASRYSQKLPWEARLDEQLEGLTPQQAARLRAHHIARAKDRLEQHTARLQRDVGRYQNQLLYDGQYRSLRRYILSLEQWDLRTLHVRADEPSLLGAFSALERSVYPQLAALTKPITLRHSKESRDVAEQLLEGVDRDGGKRIYFNWQCLGDQQDQCAGALMYMLHHKPAYAQDFITVLATDEHLSRETFPLIADALAYLALLHLKGHYPDGQGWEPTPDANTRRFVATFLNCTRHLDTAVYSQDLLHSLVRLVDVDTLKKIYVAVIYERTRFSLGTVLHYASTFGHAGEYDFALGCLKKRLRDATEDKRKNVVNSDLFRWTCATILRGSMRDVANYRETPGIVAAFVKLGVKMDLLLYDVIMRNAMEAGDYTTAFKVFNALEANGLTPDKYTYSILLHGCTTHADPAMFNTFAELCLAKAKELQDPWLATDYLYYAYTCEHNKPVADRNHTRVWAAYLSLFDPAPLAPFTRSGSRAMRDALDHETASHTPASPPKLPPPPAALYLVLQTEIHALAPLPLPYLARLYHAYTHILATPRAHPTLVRLAATPIAWNAFLHAFCARAQYADAAALIAHMANHVPPNVFTWNIFMQAFFKTQQVAAAERVGALMQDAGVEPDAYTHGVMVRGYAGAQMVRRVADVMPHVPVDEQLAPDLLRLLAGVQDRKALEEALERVRVEAQEKEAKEMRDVDM